MTDDERLRTRLVETFSQESADRLRALENGLVALESDPETLDQKNLVASLFREAHSLKGAAQVMELTDVASLAHQLEESLHALRSGPLASVSLQPIFDTLAELALALGGTAGAPETEVRAATPKRGRPPPFASPSPNEARDPPRRPRGPGRSASAVETAAPRRRRSVAPGGSGRSRQAGGHPEPRADGLWEIDGTRLSVSSAGPERMNPQSHAPAGSSPSGPGGTVRVATERLDAALARIAEIAGARDRARQRTDGVIALANLVEAWGREWRDTRMWLHRQPERDAPQSGLTTTAFDLATTGLIERLGHDLRAAARQLRHDTSRLGSLADALGSELLSLRLVPVGSLFEQFPRMVRDLAVNSGKRVALRDEGWHTEVDREVLEQLRDPVMHLLRNALDHGIEGEADRRTAGKPPVATITLAARQRGGGVVIEIADDGRGVDAARVRDAARRAGIPDADLPDADDAPAVGALLLRSGISTSPAVTAVSGRGVGLDVVRESVERLGGSVEITYTALVGTTVALQVPLTLLMANVVVVRVGDRTVALPSPAVERCLSTPSDGVTEVGGRPALRLDDGTVPLASLAGLLNATRTGGGDTGGGMVVVVRSAGGRVGLLVDAVVDERRAIVKGLGSLLGNLQEATLVAAASVIGEDGLLLVLDPGALVQAALRSDRPSRGPAPAPDLGDQRVSVLVVDDSVTTRTLERSILEAAGFAVTVAEDGVLGLEALGRKQFDVVVADVDMPRMDGLELTRRAKAQPATRDIPIILVSGLEAPEQREAGLRAGADAYVLKSRFDQQQLIDMIGRLVG